MVRTFNSNRFWKSVAASLVGAAMLCGLAAPASAASQRHVIKVNPIKDAFGNKPDSRWSVYGDLYDRNGRKVYHWQETGKKPGKDYVRWEFTDNGGGGWVHIWIDAGNNRHSFLRLPVNKNHCFQIAANVRRVPVAGGRASVAQRYPDKVYKEGNCGF
jgi:hypothetical protein